MLGISKPLNAAQAQTYHQLDYTSPTQSYYAQADAVKGEWQGKLAASLGVRGEVSALEFSRLTEGRHPLTDEQMVRHRVATEYKNGDGSTTKAVAHRAGWDAMFAPAKSVSLTALVGGDDRIREAHREAVTTALNELEKYTHARLGGNKPAELTGRFIAAKFEHDTARPVDGYAAPQLHTHAVIFNVTQRADGRTGALQEQPFFESQNFVTAVYQSELTFRLRQLGYEIEPGQSGAPEVKGYSAEYLTASSLRRGKIKEEMERKNVSGPEAAEIAARSTREKKQDLSAAQVLAAHREVAAEFGDQPRRVVAEARERAKSQEHNPDRWAFAREAVTYARASLFEREAVVDERLLMRDSLRRGMGNTTYAEVRAEFEARRERGAFLAVEAPKYASGRRFSTPEMIEAERANIGHVQAGKNAVSPIMSAELAQDQARSNSFLNDSQQRVIEEVLNSADRVHGLQGRAGTGKTSVVNSIREGAEKMGFVVEGFAPTSRAASQLREAGLEATTLQSFLARGESHPSRRPNLHHLYVLDESSLASTRQIRDFLDRLGPNDRVLVIGDTRQHQGVDAGRPFQQMQEFGMRTSSLDRIMRQRDPELLRAVEHLSRNETLEGIAMLISQGRITECADRRERIAAIARDYAARPENTIVISPDNQSRRDINNAIREELTRRQLLDSESITVRTLIHRSDMTGADRTWAARYNPGDVVQYVSGSKALGIERGAFATVQTIDYRTNLLIVEIQDGTSVVYDPRRLRGVNVFREEEREFATKDRVQFTTPLKELGVANRDLGTIERLGGSRMTVRLDGKAARTVTFNTEDVRQIDHGYAVTSHSSQGLTSGRVLAHFDTDGPRALINTRLAYVAISRASEDARIYTNDTTTLGRRLSSDLSKTAAIETSHKVEPTAREQVVSALRQHDLRAARSILQRDGKVHEYASADHRLAAVARACGAASERTVVFAPDATDRRELTTLIRDDLRKRGVLSQERHSPSILVERRLEKARSATSYLPGDQIHYKTGSPTEYGIAHHSVSHVISVEPETNRLLVRTLDGTEISYNPAVLRVQTDQSRVFREEQREISVGERIVFTQPDEARHIRRGELGSVVAIHKDSLIALRDSGESVALSGDQMRHIDYGYALPYVAKGSSAKMIVTGEAELLAQKQVQLSSVSPRTLDVQLYSSASRSLSQQLSAPALNHLNTPAKEVSRPTLEICR
jgi:conjugative relaxase-like TrwC/TraI family protein